jgi:SNF2 family DNA or RNA helicase
MDSNVLQLGYITVKKFLDLIVSYSGNGVHLLTEGVILAPLSIVDNWKQEFARFLPEFRVVDYRGNQEQREEIRKKIVDFIKLQPKDQRKDPKLNFEVYITTPEYMRKDIEWFQKFRYRYLIVDEAHSLKNHESMLYQQMLTTLNMDHVLLLTGTPIQNNIKEVRVFFVVLTM